MPATTPRIVTGTASETLRLCICKDTDSSSAKQFITVSF